jgi:hypothetical protein
MALEATWSVQCSTPGGGRGWPIIDVKSTVAENVTVRITQGSFTVADGGPTLSGGDGFYYFHTIFDDVDRGVYVLTVTGSISGAATYTNTDQVDFRCTCNLAITSIDAANDLNGQGKGYIRATATSSAGGIQYSINFSNWNTTGIFENLPAGTYTVYAKDAQNCQAIHGGIVLESDPCYTSIESFEKTDQTAPGVNDGTATMVAGNGYGAIQYKLDSGLWQSSGSFTGLAVGPHTIFARDPAACSVQQAFTIEPADVPATAYVYVPIINSLRFVPSVTVDNCTTFQTMDNTLFFDQEYAGYPKQCYYQLINKCDLIIIQWQSSYPNNSITIKNLRTETETAFAADVVTLPREYVLPTNYDIIEATLDLSAMPAGYYSVRMEGNGAGLPDYLYLGEPIHIATNHEFTSLISYRNYDQKKEIEYLTGIVHKRRVRSRFFEPTNPTSRQVFTDGIGRTINLRSQVKRKLKLRTFQIPPYLHEQLAIAFSLDELFVNGVRFAAEDDYTIAYLTQWPLGNGEVDLTEVNFASNNDHDSGDIDTPKAGIIGLEGAVLGY